MWYRRLLDKLLTNLNTLVIKKLFAFALIFGALSFINRSYGQDLYKTNPKYVKLLSDTGGIKMMLVTLPPGAKLQTHTHPLNFGYCLKGGLYKWTYTSGKTMSFLMKPGDDFHGGAESPHHSWNAGKTTIQFIILERYK